MTNTAFKIGKVDEVLNILFDPEAAKDIAYQLELAIRPKDDIDGHGLGGFSRTGNFVLSVMGSTISLD